MVNDLARRLILARTAKQRKRAISKIDKEFEFSFPFTQFRIAKAKGEFKKKRLSFFGF